MVTKTRRRTSREIMVASIKEGVIWAALFLLTFNTFHMVFPNNWGWEYGYSITGALGWVLQNAIPAEWSMLFWAAVGIIILAIWIVHFRDLVTSTMRTRGKSLQVLLFVVLATLGLFQAVYYGVTGGELFLNQHLFFNAIPAILIITVSIAGRSAMMQRAKAGTIETDQVDSDHGHDDHE